MGDETQVLLRFTTRLPPELQVPATEVAVPASLKRYGLSQIINHLLALEPARPFDFIIDGELLRKSLQQHLLAHDISPEFVVEVEYVPAVVPPEPKAALPQDDWITAVAAVTPSSLASGAADGVVRLWTSSGGCVLEFSAHKQGVNALASVAAAADQQQQQQQQQPSLLLSAGKDHAVRLWQLSAGSNVQQQQQQAGPASKASHSGSSSSSAVAHCAVIYKGHKEAVQSIMVSPDSGMCCSGGWDGQLLLWRTGLHVLDEASNGTIAEDAADAAAAAGTHKKRRVGGAAANGTAAAAAAIELEAVAALPGHVHCVSALTWPESSTVYSGGWDHSVRRYDVETRSNTDTYNGSKAVYAVAAPAAAATQADGSSSSSSIVAFGGADHVLRIWDTRSVKGEGLAVTAYNAHEGWISSIAWRPGSACQLATGGHDGSVKVWDVRSGVPLGSLEQHAQKVLSVGWWGPQQLVSGGADCKLQLYDMP